MGEEEQLRAKRLEALERQRRAAQARVPALVEMTILEVRREENNKYNQHQNDVQLGRCGRETCKCVDLGICEGSWRGDCCMLESAKY